MVALRFVNKVYRAFTFQNDVYKFYTSNKKSPQPRGSCNLKIQYIYCIWYKTIKRPVTACNTANVGQKCAIVITRNDVTSGAARVYDLLNYSTPDGALVAQKKRKVKYAGGRWRKKVLT